MKKIRLSILFCCIGYCLLAQGPCPNYGSATKPKEKKLNIAKNRSVTVSSSKKADYIPLNELITTRRKEDSALYTNGMYVYTEGFLISFEEEGPESCNCNMANKKAKNGDVHMYLGLVNNAPKKNCIVVELTPAYKKKHPDYATQLIKGQKVRIFGYMLYDYLHRGQSFNTCKSCNGVWRKTCWEIHPVTAIEQL